MGSSWIFQGVLYMDATERIFKIIFEILLLFINILIFVTFINPLHSVIIGLISAHTLNWILNGQIPVALRNAGVISTTPLKIIEYSIYIKGKIVENPFIIYGAIIGSLSRDEIRTGSDLDIRVVRREGFISGIYSSIFVMKLRLEALFYLFPLDIYLLDSKEKISNLREPPVVFLNIINNMENL